MEGQVGRAMASRRSSSAKILARGGVALRLLRRGFRTFLFDTAFLVTVVLIVAFLLGYQALSQASATETLSLLALFLLTAVIEFQMFKPR